jgi:hypothetical protein
MINIVKSQPAPPCLEIEKLKNNGTYNCDDVFERIVNDFHCKCYICEDKETSIQIEHFEPHKDNDIDLKFDWNNLFYACGHCNNLKGIRFDNILNCIDPNHRIVDFIKFEMDILANNYPEISALNDDEKTHNTVALIQEVYAGKTKHKTQEAVYIRKRLSEEMRVFSMNVLEYFDKNIGSNKRADLKELIINALLPSSPFTAFKV